MLGFSSDCSFLTTVTASKSSALGIGTKGCFISGHWWSSPVFPDEGDASRPGIGTMGLLSSSAMLCKPKSLGKVWLVALLRKPCFLRLGGLLGILFSLADKSCSFSVNSCGLKSKPFKAFKEPRLPTRLALLLLGGGWGFHSAAWICGGNEAPRASLELMYWGCCCWSCSFAYVGCCRVSNYHFT